jgi:uncharacterized membrane protein
MGRISKWVMRGVGAMLPLLLTAYLVYWAVKAGEDLVGPLMKRLLGESRYVPGMGLVAAVALLVLIGAVAQVWLSRLIGRLVNAVLSRIPLVKTLYGSLRDMMRFVAGEGKTFSQVVLVNVPGWNAKVVGLVTREEFPTNGPFPDRDRVVVYIPWSYGVGGFPWLVRRSDLEPITMSVEAAMMFCMTAGVTLGLPPGAPKPVALPQPATE